MLNQKLKTTIILENSPLKIFNSKLFNLKKIFVFKGDQRKFLWVNFFKQCNNIFTRQCEKQPDNGSDRYTAKYKHRLGSEHTFEHVAEFLQSSFHRPRVAARALILHASN